MERLLLLVLLVAMALGSACGSLRTPPAPATPPAPVGPGIEVPAEVRLGRVLAGATARGGITVRALRAGRLVAVQSSCECTTADAVVPRAFTAGEEFEIPVAINLAKVGEGGLPKPGSGPGHVRRDVVLRTDGGEVKTSVAVDVSDLARIEPASLVLGAVPLGTTAVGSVNVLAGPSTSGIHVTSVETSANGLEAAVVREGDADRIDFKWTAPEIGHHEATVLVGLDLAEEPLVRLAVGIDVLPPVRVQPERIENLAASLSQPVVTRLAVTRLDGKRLEVLGAESDNHRVLVELLPGSGPERIVQVIIPVMGLPLESAGAVTIRTPLAGSERLVVPFRVRAAPPG